MRHQITSYHKYKPSDPFSTSFIVTAALRIAGRVAPLPKGSALLVICTLFIGFSCPLTAQAGETWRGIFVDPAVFEDIQAGDGMANSRPSGVQVFDDIDKRHRLGDKGAEVFEGLPRIRGEIGYGLQSTGTMVSAGGGIEAPWRVSIGRRGIGWSQVSLCTFYEEKDMWESPDLISADPDETDADFLGYLLDWNNFLNTGIRIFSKGIEIEVDPDRIGDILPDLRRDGADTILGIRYPLDLGGGGVLSSGISYILIDRDGVANSGHGYAAELNHIQDRGRFSFATSLELVAREFDETHPVFNEKREEAAYTVSETVSYAEPFGYTNSYLFGVAAYSETVANNTFFEGDTFILGAGVSCRL